MHALIRLYQTQPGRMEDRLRHHREVSVPLIRQRPGNRGLLYLVDRAAGTNFVVTLWESEAAMQAAEAHEAYRAQLGDRHFAAGDVTTTSAAVAIWDPAQGGSSPVDATAARVTSFAVPPSRLDERLRHHEERGIPAIRRHSGYQGFLLLEDQTDSRTLLISLWRTPADLEQMARDADYEQLRAHHHFATGPATQHQFEVITADLPADGYRGGQ